jgi:hypothetical protein
VATIDLEPLQPLLGELRAHPLYDDLQTPADLRLFMNHHVFAVWDFMCLLKSLQDKIAPVGLPWFPVGRPGSRHLVNRLVLEEESDPAPGPGGTTLYASHFEHYCRALDEVGADGTLPYRFLERVRDKGVDQALYCDLVPVPARYFAETTFTFIREDKPHVIAAALVLGRLWVIPPMARQILARIGVAETEAPGFYHYLNRHLPSDLDLRNGLALELLEALCAEDPERLEEAETAAEEAICAWIRFFDGIRDAIRARRGV